jgi:hypothetical protein
MQGFVNHKPKRYVPRSRQHFSKHPSGADDALRLTGFAYSYVSAPQSVYSCPGLVHRAGSRVTPVKVSGGTISLPDLGD